MVTAETCKSQQVGFVLGQSLRRQDQNVGDRLGFARPSSEIAQRPCSPLCEHLGRHRDDGVKQAADLPDLVPDGTEKERKETLLQEPVPFEDDVLGLQERFVACQGSVMRLADDGPRFFPALGKVLRHRARRLVAADEPVSIVVELFPAPPPDDANGQVRSQADADGRGQALRPPGHRSERRRRSVHRSDQVARRLAAREESEGVGCAGAVALIRRRPWVRNWRAGKAPGFGWVAPASDRPARWRSPPKCRLESSAHAGTICTRWPGCTARFSEAECAFAV